jgi:transcriptional regulator with XRE-family HTH domain
VPGDGACVACVDAAKTEFTDLVHRLAQTRRHRRITQASLGGVLGLTGVSIANWEGGRVPSAGNFILWAEALDLAFVVVDEARRRYQPRPVPRADESIEQYRLRCIALVLRDRRLEADLTQETVGERLDVSPWTVQMWENARRVPRIAHLIQWCCVLGCRLDLAPAR